MNNDVTPLSRQEICKLIRTHAGGTSRLLAAFAAQLATSSLAFATSSLKEVDLWQVYNYKNYRNCTNYSNYKNYSYYINYRNYKNFKNCKTCKNYSYYKNYRNYKN